MAAIVSADGTKLIVDPVSQAARTTIYDADGSAAVYDTQTQPASGVQAGLMGMVLNDRAVIAARGDRFGSQAVALHTPLFYDSFDGATVNATARWSQVATGATVTQLTANGLTITGNTTSANGAIMSSRLRIPRGMRALLQYKTRIRVFNQLNALYEWGLAVATAVIGTVPTTGAWFRRDATGALKPVVAFNGVETLGTDIASLITNTNYYTHDILIDDDEVVFVTQDSATGLILNRQTISCPLANSRLFSDTGLNVWHRTYNSGTPAANGSMIVSDVYVALLDQNQSSKSWRETQAAQQRNFCYDPSSGTALPQWTNSVEPGSATLSNTAAGYVTLGGKFLFAAPAGASTDYALFSYTVPASSNFTCTGVNIDLWNTGAASATTPTLLTWFLAPNMATASLATANARVPVGTQSIPVGAAIGANVSPVQRQFSTPVHTTGGRNLTLGVRIPVGSATASQVIAGMAAIEGYFD